MSKLRKKLVNPSFREKTGFTLIELLVVIAIIAILAVIVLAAVGVARQRGRVAAAKAKCNSVASMVELYANDFDGTYPASMPLDGNAPVIATPSGGSSTNYGTWPKTPEGDIKYTYTTGGTTYQFSAWQGLPTGVEFFRCTESGCKNIP